MDNTLMENEYMLRAIELAKKGAGAVNPNPLVGAVIVKDGRIIGEGYHARFGDLHAERNAIKNAKERGEDMRGLKSMSPWNHVAITDINHLAQRLWWKLVSRKYMWAVMIPIL